MNGRYVGTIVFNRLQKRQQRAWLPVSWNSVSIKRLASVQLAAKGARCNGTAVQSGDVDGQKTYSPFGIHCDLREPGQLTTLTYSVGTQRLMIGDSSQLQVSGHKWL